MMTSREFQQQINANAREQERILADASLPGAEKGAILRELRDRQSLLYTRRDAALRAEQGREPRERVGVL